MKLNEKLWLMRVSLENLTDDELATFDEAIALAKSVESAPVGSFEDVANTVSYVGWIDTMPGRELPIALRDSLNGQRVALVPLPQPEES